MMIPLQHFNYHLMSKTMIPCDIPLHSVKICFCLKTFIIKSLLLKTDNEKPIQLNSINIY